MYAAACQVITHAAESGSCRFFACLCRTRTLLCLLFPPPRARRKAFEGESDRSNCGPAVVCGGFTSRVPGGARLFAVGRAQTSSPLLPGRVPQWGGASSLYCSRGAPGGALRSEGFETIMLEHEKHVASQNSHALDSRGDEKGDTRGVSDLRASGLDERQSSFSSNG